MKWRRQSDESDEEPVDRAIAAYLVRREAGETVDRKRMLAEHPDEAQALAEFFNDDDFMNDLSKPMK